MSKFFYKRIALIPTEWTADVFVSKDETAIADKQVELYGAEKEYYLEQLSSHRSFVNLIHSKVDGYMRIVCVLRDFNIQTLVHEAVHVTWFLDNQVKFKFSYENQEIQAYMVDYLVGEILKMKKGLIVLR